MALQRFCISCGDTSSLRLATCHLRPKYGPLFFRLLIGHAALDERFTDGVLAHALRGLKP
jgi:hypothetical protein